MGELELLQVKLERALVLLRRSLALTVVVLLDLERHLGLFLQLRNVVLVLVQQMLHLLLVHLRASGLGARPRSSEATECELSAQTPGGTSDAASEIESRAALP